MTPEDFLEWRKSLSLTQSEAAARLGVSKRSIATYEGSGPVPKTVALACVAVTNEAQTGRFLEKLVRQQHPELGEYTLVLPFVVERESTYADLIEVGFSAEAQEWVQENTPSAAFAMKTVITPDMRRRQVALVTFKDLKEATYFKLRWE